MIQGLLWREDRALLRLDRTLHLMVVFRRFRGLRLLDGGLDRDARPGQPRDPLLHRVHVHLGHALPRVVEAQGEAHCSQVGHDRLRAGTAVAARVRSYC